MKERYLFLVVFVFINTLSVAQSEFAPPVIEEESKKNQITPVSTTKPKPPTTKPTIPTWKTNFDKKFSVLKSNENSYQPQTMIDKYTELLYTLPNTAKTEKELIYARIELLKTKIDKDSDGDGFTDKNDNCPNQYAKNNNGGPRNGYFTVTYDNGTYTGYFVNDKKEDKGTYTWSYGDKYEGDWKDDNQTGKGTYTWVNGNKYDGDWKDGKREGKGTLTWADGSKYEGDWKDDKITGYGKKTWANGDEYLGNFLDGYLHGYGVYSSKSGHLNNCPECVKYDGQWINGKKDVMGNCYDKNSILIYSGKFKDDKPVYTYPMSGLNDFLNDAIKIGTQTWSGKNLDVAYFRNGDPIPEAKTDAEWKKAGENKQPAWCYYNNDPANGKKYGKLYNWYAVDDKRGLAPAGWHIPSEKEWNILIDYLGGDLEAGGKLKALTDWESPNKGATNSSGFTALPAGIRESKSFSYQKLRTYFWISKCSLFNPIFILLYHNEFVLGRGGTEGFNYFYSVRCIKD